MHPRIEPKSIQRQLSNVVIREVLKTTMHRRDPEDLVTTKFFREPLDDEADRTLPFELPFELEVQSAPYELLEIIVPADDLDTIPFDLIEEHELCASRNLVAMDEPKQQPFVSPPRRPLWGVGVVLLLGAFGLGFGIGLAFFAL